MGGALFGKSNQTASQPIASTLRIQTSIYGRPRPIGAGQNRFSGNMLWWGNFQASRVATPGGKGGAIGSALGKGNGDYTYSVSAIMGLGDGPIVSIDTLYNGNVVDFFTLPAADVVAALETLGIVITVGIPGTLTLFLGTYPQTPWSYLTTFFPSQALPYPGEPFVAFTNQALGYSSSFPAYNWEVTWALNSSPDAPSKDINPAAWVAAFLTNSDWGVNGFSPALLGDLSAFSVYAQAYGLWMSPLLTDQMSAQSHLEDLMKATAADFKWSQGALTIGIYADLPNTANSATFEPSLTPVYVLTDADFMKNQGSLGQGSGGDTSIAVARKNPTQAVNTVQLEFLDRYFIYNPSIITITDEASLQDTGWQVLSDLRTHHFFCYRAAAVQSCALQLGRERILAQYQFTLGAQFVLLEIFDVVSLTEPALGFAGKLVRIIEIQENSDGTFTCTAEDVPGTLGAVSYNVQAALGAAYNAGSAPGSINAPIIFEPPAALAANSIWAAVSGVAQTIWGGCYVWVSTDGGAQYAQVGQIVSPARQGVTTNLFPSVTANPSGQSLDTTNTLDVNLSESFGALTSATSDDELNLVTLCYVDGELISYENATLTTTYNYDLDDFVRGAYGSPIGSHAIGSQFARLDSAIFKYQYDAGQIGLTIQIKFQSYNIYGGGVEDLSSITAYPHTIAGAAGRTDTYTQTTNASGTTTQVFSPQFHSGPQGYPAPFVNITWTSSPGDSLNIISVTVYQVVYEILNATLPVVRVVTIMAEGY